MSDPKECGWCRLKKDPPQGRFTQGTWICYTCFPNNVKLLEKSQKCSNCGKKSNEGLMQGKSFICSVCNPFYHYSKTGKKRRKKWEYEESFESTAKKEKKTKHKQRQQQEADKQSAKEKKRTRWVVVITDISTGDL